MKRILLLLGMVAAAVAVYRIVGHEDLPYRVGGHRDDREILGHEDIAIRRGSERKPDILGHEDIQI